MTSTNGRNSRHLAPRRGVTLVEMLVTVAVLVIIMTVLVQIFQSATGALTAAQVIQDLDNQIKLLESTMRSDLGGATAHFTPPLDPTQNLGYFEYIENEFADTQGEDSDDCLRFTAQAPPGQPFTGRIWVTQPANAQLFYNPNVQPVTVTSEYAEIIYFLRNGNLYRRVLLIAPELQTAIVPSVGNLASPSGGNVATASFTPTGLGGVAVSWQGVNDLSAHPASTGPNSATVTQSSLAQHTIVLNSLSSLTNKGEPVCRAAVFRRLLHVDGESNDRRRDNRPQSRRILGRPERRQGAGPLSDALPERAGDRVDQRAELLE